MVEAGCITFDDLPPVTRLEYSIDHADVFLSELAAERLMTPLCHRDVSASEIAEFAAGVAVVALKGFSAAAAAAILKFAQMGIAVIPVPFEGSNRPEDEQSHVFDERDVTWENVSWSMIQSDGLLMVVCDKLQSEGLYLARHAQQQQQPNLFIEPNIFFSCGSAVHTPVDAVAFKIRIAGRTVALAAPFSFVLPLASTASLAPPSPVVAYLAASCARQRDLPQLLALMTSGADVFSSMAALPLINDAMGASGVVAEDGQLHAGIISDEDKHWLLCAASAWALDAGQGSSANEGGSLIISACLQSADVLNDLCALPLLSIQV